MRSLQSDWEASSEEEKPAVPAPLAPAKKKGSLKQKLAEKEAARQARLAAGDDDDDEVEYDEDAALDPHAKARLEKERELESDIHNAKDLFGSATVKGVCVRVCALSFSPSAGDLTGLTQTPSLALSHRLVRRRPRHHPEIDAQIQGGLYRALGRHHRARHQRASRQAAVRRFCGAPRARPCRAAARCRCAQGGERTHDTCE